MKKLEPKDIEIGDILIFENKAFDPVIFLSELMKDYNESDPKKRTHAAFYLLLYLIPWFDPGDEGEDYKNIYHAAVWGNVNIYRGEGKEPVYENRIVQAGTHGVGQASLYSTLRGEGVENIYVYRRKERSEGFETKLNQAIRQFYDDTSIAYSYETAWLLAVICSLRYTDGQLHEILKKELGAEAADIVIVFVRQLINEYSDSHQHNMVACSTLVAIMYKNAGFPLHVDALKVNPEIDIPKQVEFKPDLFGLYSKSQSMSIPKLDLVETVITPRQLTESPDVELVGILPHIDK